MKSMTANWFSSLSCLKSLTMEEIANRTIDYCLFGDWNA
jgi:hypothetical protein